MKKIFLSLSLAFALNFSVVFAQENTMAEIDSTSLKNWYHQNYEKTGVYGVGTDDAIDFVKSKGLKPSTIIVGVIDSGVQIDHPDLKNNIWVNPKEKPNNKKDDDKNGYADDVHGWDFIGGKDGKDVNQDTMEATRVVVKYENLFEGTDASANQANITKYPNEYQEYKRAKLVYDSKLKATEKGLNNIQENQKQIGQMVSTLRMALGNKTITEENAQNIANSGIKNYILMLAEDESVKGKTIDEFEKIALAQLKEGLDYFGNQEKYMLNKDFDPRNIVGDNYADLTQKYYGNQEVEGPDALHGTHVSGIIAAERNNHIGMDGIAGDVAKIMVVRAVPNGDERDKDIANAIFYAVDNGAKIINMSFGKSFSPNKERVWEAMKYAESKGVLMVHAAGNDNKNLDLTFNYPTNYKDGEKTSFVNNWITVGASTRYNDKLKASFSNYGQKVDIFAPGLEIYSTITKSGYKFLQGTSMASPVVAGCAALLWAYFPNLTAIEVKDILIKTSNKNTDPLLLDEDADTTFDKLSVSGGVVDVYKAVKYAYENYASKARN
ncbi:S8 family peptidase [Apibacter adventoris]|uniref:S8 family peptidase n=1 Tax=Apibacter adventoris TaxID=1679466 RepID=UPI000CF669FD|nr:S8 family peptidase [Apibacter adventoris]PQL95219.1 peptidase S8 [Apibacter adventoris]